MAVVDFGIPVDFRLAVNKQLRPAETKNFDRGQSGQEAILDVSKYLSWSHRQKDIVILTEYCGSY